MADINETKVESPAADSMKTSAAATTVAATPPAATGAAGTPARANHRGGFLHFLGWVFSGFGVLRHTTSRYKSEEIIVYSVHRSFFLWALILFGFIASAVLGHMQGKSDTITLTLGMRRVTWLYIAILFYTFILLLFDLNTMKLLLWGLIFALLVMTAKYIESAKQIPLLHPLVMHFANLHPVMSAGVPSIISWLLLIPWVVALFTSYSHGRKSFSPNGIEERFLGEGVEITDRSGLHFVCRYRDLLETVLGFGAGDLDAIDSTGKVVKRWENILGLIFVWRKLDEVLHQRSAVVDNAPADPVEVENVKKG